MWNKFNTGGSVPQMMDSSIPQQANGTIPRYDADGSGPIYGDVAGGNQQISPNVGPDSVSAMLRPGEYVMRPEAVQALGGVEKVNELNALGGPNNPQKYANQRPPNPSMSQSPLSGRMPLTEITKRDRHGASVTMKFDAKAQGGSYQDADGLWGILNEMQQEATMKQSASKPYRDGGLVPPMMNGIPHFFGGGWLSALFSPDEERQAELAETAKRIAAADEANAVPEIQTEDIPYGDEAVLQTSSQADKQKNEAESVSNRKGRDSVALSAPPRPDDWDPRYDGGAGPGGFDPSAAVNNALDNAGQPRYEPDTANPHAGLTPYGDLVAEPTANPHVQTMADVPYDPRFDIENSLDNAGQARYERDTANPHAGITSFGDLATSPTANPHAGIPGYRETELERDSRGDILNANDNRILSDERTDELNNRLASGKITQEQYDNLVNDSNAARKNRDAFDTEQTRLDELKSIENQRINAGKVKEQITNIDTKIAAAETSGNAKLLDVLNKEKARLQGQLPGDETGANANDKTETPGVETPAAKARRLEVERLAAENQVKVDETIAKIDKKQGAGVTTPMTPEEKSAFNAKATELLAAGKSGTTGDKAEDNWFKKEFSGAFEGLFGPGGIGSALARGLILYAGGRLTGMSGQQALAFASQDALDEGSRKNKAIADARIAAKADAKETDEWIRDNLKDFTGDSLKKYRRTKNVADLVSSTPVNQFEGFGEELRVQGLGNVFPKKGPGGKGQYVEINGVDYSLAQLDAAGIGFEPVRDEHKSEYLVEELTGYAKKVRASKGIEVENAGYVDDDLAGQINEVVQDSAILYPKVKLNTLMHNAKLAMQDTIDYANKYPDAGVIDGGIFMRARMVMAENPQIAAAVSGSDPDIMTKTANVIRSDAQILAKDPEQKLTTEQARKKLWDENMASFNYMNKNNKHFKRTYEKKGKELNTTPALAYSYVLRGGGDAESMNFFNQWENRPKSR